MTLFSPVSATGRPARTAVMIRHLQEARARAKEQGWGPVMGLIRQALRDRMTNPWHLMYWIPTTEVNLVPLPVNGIIYGDHRSGT